MIQPDFRRMYECAIEERDQAIRNIHEKDRELLRVIHEKSLLTREVKQLKKEAGPRR